jgi:serine/threonine-protein kinase ATR
MNIYGAGKGHDDNMGHDVPPSTLAANLVNNLSSTRRQTKTQDQEEFRKLLLEFSETSNGAGTNLNAQETLEHHHKLICVVTKAVLEPLAAENPFANWELQIQQASEGLEILIITIKSTPDVLAHVARSESLLRMVTQLPLWLWLFPRLLTLCARSKCENLQQNLKETFRSIFNSVMPSLSLWPLKNSLFCYLRRCTDGMNPPQRCNSSTPLTFHPEILHQLQEKTIIQHGRGSSICITLPPVTLDEDILLEGTSDLLTAGYTYTLSVASDAIHHVSFILQILVNIYSLARVSYDAFPALKGYLAWTVDTISTFREILRAFASEHEIVELSTVVNSNLLILARSSSKNDFVPIKRKIYQILATSCAELLQVPDHQSDTACSDSLSECLEYFSGKCNTNNDISEAIKIHLLPSFPDSGEVSQTSDEPAIRWKVMPPKARPCNFANSCQHFIHNMRARFSMRLGYELTASFDNMDLTVPGDLFQEPDRPTKRRKVAIEQSALGSIVKRLWLLLGSQEVSDIDGLSLVAAQVIYLL